MNRAYRKELWERLKTAQLVTDDLPEETGSPWFVRVMLGVSGWIGALFILGFIASAFDRMLNTADSVTVAAVICCAGAYAIFRMTDGDFSGQFGLALGLAGQILFCIAIFKYSPSDSFTNYLLIFSVEAALTLLIPNFIHRVFTSFAAVIALSVGFAQAGLHGLALPLVATGCAAVWRSEFRLATRINLWHPVGYGLALGLLQTASTALFAGHWQTFTPRDGGTWLQQHSATIGTALVCVVFFAVALDIIRSLAIEISSRQGTALLCCIALIMAVSFPAHGLAASLLLLILGFAGGNRVLFGLGFLAQISFLSYYYYQMQQSLLIKSCILFATGLFLLLIRLSMRRLFPEEAADDHA